VIAETCTGLSFVLVERIGVDLGVSCVVDVLGNGVPSSTSHGSKNDKRGGDGSDDDTSNNNTGNDSKEGKADLLLRLAGSERLRAVGDGTRRI